MPYISDPNTGVDMFESAEIVKYLLDTYTVRSERIAVADLWLPNPVTYAGYSYCCW